MNILITVIFALTFWLGLYLLQRPNAKWAVRLAGAGILLYAFALVTVQSLLALPLVIGTAICWVGAISLEMRQHANGSAHRPITLLWVAAIFFGLSVAALLLLLRMISPTWLILGIGVDVLLLGVAIARLDAFDEGETLWPDLLRSFAGSVLACIVFGGLMSLAGASRVWVLLTLACTISFEVFATRWQGLLDRVVFVQQPQLQTARAELREVAQALPRLVDIFDPASVDNAEFVRLTRRAISALGDLPKLTTSPLTRLPLINAKLAQITHDDNPIERANILKQLLTESILSLRPPHANGTGMSTGFGTSDEWRHFNALYFPYVIGLKPYSVRAEHPDLDEDTRAALVWFRTSIPERTLYNWQTAAAKLVAQHLMAVSR